MPLYDTTNAGSRFSQRQREAREEKLKALIVTKFSSHSIEHNFPSQFLTKHIVIMWRDISFFSVPFCFCISIILWVAREA